MAESEPSTEKDEPSAAVIPTGATSSAAHNGTQKATADGGTTSRTEAGDDQQEEIDEFGLPVKRTRQRSTSFAENAEGLEEGEPREEGHQIDDASETHKQPSVQEHCLQDPQATGYPAEQLNGREKTLPSTHSRKHSHEDRDAPVAEPQIIDNLLHGGATGGVSGWSHQALAPHKPEENTQEKEEWQDMPAFAPFDLYDDDGKLVAREVQEQDDEDNAYKGLGGAGKGYTRVQVDEDAQSATSMDDNTDYLFKPKGTDLDDEDEEQRDPLAQLQATKNLLTEGQRIAYVGLTRLAMAKMAKEIEEIESTKSTKKGLAFAVESMKMWSQQMMVRLYMHMEIDSSGKFYYVKFKFRFCLLMKGRTNHDRAIG